MASASESPSATPAVAGGTGGDAISLAAALLAANSGAASAVSAGAASDSGESASVSSPRITATTVLMGTVCPSPTLISDRIPALGDGISVSTLSVEISNSGSSRSTRCPTALYHLVTVPSAMLSPIWGMMTSVAMSQYSQS